MYIIEKSAEKLLTHIGEILEIANSEKDALGFIPEAGYRDAIRQNRIMATLSEHTEAQRVTGFIMFGGIFPHATVQQIGVSRTYRRSGTASALLDALVSHLEIRGYNTLKAAIASDLTASLAFYQRNGFELLISKPGGQARRRTILVHVRQLDNEDLFSRARRNTTNHDFLVRPNVRQKAPFYTFDLNVLFDLIRDRDRHEIAAKLFGAALGHQIRLAVCPEFSVELERTSTNNRSDPVLQMARRLPRLPSANQEEITKLAERIHSMVFERKNARGSGTVQALSDTRHLAHSVISGASAFITSDAAILNARDLLLSELGLDVATISELVSLLPNDDILIGTSHSVGDGFECKTPSTEQVVEYLRRTEVSPETIAEFTRPHSFDTKTRFEAVFQHNTISAISAFVLPTSIDDYGQLLVHVSPGCPQREIFADYLLNSCVRSASDASLAMIELRHLAGQATVSHAALSCGFLTTSKSKNMIKVAIGRPITSSRWATIALQLQRKSGIFLSKDTNDASNPLQVRNGDHEAIGIQAKDLEHVLGPTLITWPDREATLVPIARTFADELLGTSDQGLLPFIVSRTASFLSTRVYVSNPRSAGYMKPGRAIAFYESKRTRGRGAVVAVARVVDSVVTSKKELGTDDRKRMVIENVEEFARTDDVLLTRFDNVLRLPKPVALNSIRKLGAVGKLNLITAQPITSEQLESILDAGWPAD